MSPFVSLWQQAWRRRAGPQSSARPSGGPALLASGGCPPSRTAARSTAPAPGAGGAVQPVSAGSWWSHAPVALQEAGERPPEGPCPHRLAHARSQIPPALRPILRRWTVLSGLEPPCGHLLHLQADRFGGCGADEGTGPGGARSPGPFALSEAQKGGDNARPPKGAASGLEWGVGLGWCPAKGFSEPGGASEALARPPGLQTRGRCLPGTETRPTSCVPLPDSFFKDTSDKGNTRKLPSHPGQGLSPQTPCPEGSRVS